MNLTKFNSNTLREMLVLSERKEALIAELQKIEDQLLSQLGLFSKTITQPVSINGKQAPKKTSLKASKSSKKGSKRPSLKKAILATLTEVGSSGITVADLAKKVGAKNSSIHSWFYNNMEKLSEIERVGPGHFRINQKS